MIHPLADVQSQNIGEETSVWQFAIILKEAVIGANCNINCHTFIENDVIIGNHVTIKSGVYLWDGIRIEDYAFIGPNATFVNNQFARSKQYPKKHIAALIKKGASIGANATIMGNLTIGEFAFIGAGSVVTKHIPAYQVWYGNPAEHKGYITKEGEAVGLDLLSKSTERGYKYENNKLIEL